MQQQKKKNKACFHVAPVNLCSYPNVPTKSEQNTKKENMI